MNVRPAPGLRVLILAAGASSRLGQPKALARIRGTSLLRRTALLLAPLSARPLIVVAPPRMHRYRPELRGVRADLVTNPAPSSGLSGSLRLGIAQARWSAATLIVPVDLGALVRADALRLLRRWQAQRRRIVARRIGGRAGVPLILPRHLYALAKRARGDEGLRELLGAVAPDRCLRIDLPSAGADIDTPAELRLARLGKTPRQKLPASHRHPRG